MNLRNLTPSRLFSIASLAITLVLVSVSATSFAQQSKLDPVQKKHYTELLKESHNTISFTENKGQWEKDIVSVGKTNIGSLVVKKDMLYFLSMNKNEEHEEHEEEEEEGYDHIETKEVHGWGLLLEGANLNSTITQTNQFVTINNYFMGEDPRYHASGVRNFGELTMHEVYDGVALRMYSQERNTLEFDWIVAAGKDYSSIKMRLKGQDGVRIDEKGNLCVKLSFDEVKFDIPEAYQIVEGKKVPVRMQFKLDGDFVTFTSLDKIDSRYELVIDPSLKWGTFFDNNSDTFDEYLFAVEVDNVGNVYCGGSTNMAISTGAGNYINPATLFGAFNAYGSGQDGIIYKFNALGTAITAITYYGASGGNDRVYGLSLSPDNSVIFACGFAANGVNVPMTGTLATSFDNSRDNQDGWVAAFPASTLGSLLYATYIGGSGASPEEMVSVRALSNNSFVVGGTVTAALPTAAPNYIVNAYDNSFSGGNEMYIAKFTNFNTLTFGTYVGGSAAEQLNDIAIFSDGAIAFSGFTASTTATFPGLVNGASSGVSGNQDGVVGVIPSSGGTFSMLSRIGGSDADDFYGIAIDPFDTLYITGFTSSTNFPLGIGASATTRFDNTHNGGQDGILCKIPRSGFTGGTDPWMATYFGGSGNDRGNTLRTYTPYAAMIFGETGSGTGSFPCKNINDGGAFYDSTYNGGTWDIFWMVLGTDLRQHYYSTYVGGAQNDYLGNTGTPKGSNQFVVEGDSLIVLGTTTHSTHTNIEPVVLGPTTGPNATFDPINSTGTDDKHIIFKWRIGILLNFDYGDAPASYGNPNHVIVGGLKLGTANTDPEDFPNPTQRANGDDLNGSTPDDEDGIPGTQVMVQDTSTSYTQTISLSNPGLTTAYLMGWIDFNRNGVFENSEVATNTVPPGATSRTLTWTGYNFNTLPTVDTSYMRIRITTQASFNTPTPSPTANAANGEVEDYLVIRFRCVNLTGATITTQNPTTCTPPNGSITISNGNLVPGVTYGVYYTLNGGSPQGPFTYTTNGTTGTLVISGLTSGTYTAVQVFHPTNPACGFTLPGTYVLSAASVPVPGLTASADNVCVGGSFTLTASSAQVSPTYNWTGPSGFTFTGNPLTRSSVTTAMTGSYCVTQTVAGCTSAPACTTITVNPNPTLSASSNTPVCVGNTINLTSTPGSGTLPYNTFSWSGVGGFSASTQNPTRGPATPAMAGAYNVTVTDARGCTATATTSVAINAVPTTAPTNNSPICSGATLNLFANAAAGSGTISGYSWSGPSFTSTIANPTRPSATTAMSGAYSVTVTNSNGCTASASTNVTINQSPSVSASSSQPAYCTGATIQLNANPSGGTTPYTYSWSGPSTFSSSAQNPTRGPATAAMGGVYNVTVTDNNGCSASTSTSTVAINPSPSISANSGSPTYCSGQTIQLTSAPSGGSTPYSYSWSGPASFSATVQNPTRPGSLVSHSGVYSVTLTDNNGCTATASTPAVTVNETPVVSAFSSSPSYCTGSTIQLNSTVTGGTTPYTFVWSGPATYSASTQNPTRVNAQPIHSGVYSVTVTTNNGCSATAQTGAITVNPGLNITAGSNSPACTGGTLNLSSSVSGGTTPYTYSWTGPGFTSNLQNPSRTNVVAGFAGTYNITVTDANNCSGTASTNVVVNTGVGVSASSNSPVCVGSTLNLSGSPLGGTSPYTYSWTGPSGYSAGGQNPTRTNIQTIHAGTYNVTITDVNGCSATGSTAVVVNTNPSVSAGSNSPICAGATLNLTSTPSGGSTPYSYSWSGPVSYSAFIQNPTRSLTITAHSGTYSVTLTDNNGCSATASTVVTVNATPSVTASSNSPVCETRTINLTSTPSGGTGTYSYAWAGPSTFSASIQNPTRANASSGFAGAYNVTVTDGNNCTASAATSVTVLPKPGVPTASASPNPICTGQTLNLTGTGSGAATWNWFGPNSFGASIQNPTINNVQLVNAGTYFLFQTLSGCSSDTAQVTVVVNPTPAAPVITTVLPNPACTGQNVTFTASGAGGSIFTWSGPGFSTTGNPVTLSSVALINQGNFTVTQTITGCVSPSSAPVFLTVNQTPTAPTPTTNSPKCWGDTLKFFASTVAGATYSWSGPGGFTSAAQSPTRPLATPSMSGLYSLTVTVSGCSSTNSATVNATVTSCPPVANDDAYSTNEDTPLTISAPGVLVNDSDPANPQQPLTVTTTPVSGPTNGSVVLNANGSFTYTPNANYTGLDVFCYRVCDNEIPAACDTACVTITVVPVNDPPVVNDSTVTSPEDNPITVCLPITDPETATQLHNVTLCGVTNGTVSGLGVNNGTNPHTVCFTYNPTANFNGTAQVCVIVCDNGSPVLCDTATVTINVTPVNDPPVANDDTYSTNEDTPLTISAPGVLSNDSDPADGTVVTVVGVVSGPANGTLTLNANGSFVYTPNANFNGVDVFCYRITDSGTPAPFLFDTACVTITVNSDNDPPVVNDSTVTTPEDNPITLCLPISDPESATQLHSVTLCGVTNGTVSGLSVNNGTIPHSVCLTYNPTANFNGTAQVCVVVCDNGSPVLCDTALVTVNVTPVNDPPVAVNDFYSTNEDVPLITSSVTGVRNNDNDAADGNPVTSLTVNSTPFVNVSHGTLILNGDGSFTYTPTANYCGSDSFVYTVCDNGTPLPSLCANATAYITVNCVNDPPVVNDSTVTTPEDVPITVCLPITDAESATQLHSVTVCGGPSNGSLSGTLGVNNGTNPHTVCFTYTPNLNYNGTDQICLVICDNGSPVACDTARVTIIVTPVNDPPVAVDDYFVNCTGSNITNNVLTNDNDVDGPLVTVLGPLAGPYSGTLTIAGTGLFTYTPPSPLFNGIDSFTYVICDGGSPVLCDTAVVVLDYRCVNVPPIAVDDTYTVPEDGTLTVSVPGIMTNDSDPDGGIITVTTPQLSGTNHGTLTLNANGSFTYVPNPNYTGLDTFQYSICDNGTPVKCDSAFVFITVTPVNDPPVVPDTTIVTCEDCPITVCLPITDVETNQSYYVAGAVCGPNSGTYTTTIVALPSNQVCVTYTPTTNFNGVDSICLVVCDNGTPNQCDTTKITIVVTPVNDPPIANNDTYTTNEDTPLNISAPGV
ncbi:MAG: tandem-95 repeat protein, partial [Chitinophagales bacterium]|nr:tandem-95 repeat protein [Chitinophagales bacterium]